VTGAGRRLGRAIALGLARAGCDVALHYHTSAAGAGDAAREIGALGRRAELLEADLRDAEAARALAPRAAGALGRLDVLINSAAIMVRQPIESVTPDSWDATFDLNVRAAFFVTQGALPALRAARGKIVNLADVAAFEPWPAYVPHGASKAALVMLTKGLARALAPDVAVNAVAPGPVLVPDEWDAAARERLRASTPLGRLGTPDDAVRAVLFLLTGTDFVTGTILVVDGGRLIR
jgi:pteridine reductase